MKIQQLFEELEKITKDKKSVFQDSGMANWYNKMKYGFFPLGLGVLTEDISIDSSPKDIEIDEDAVMILGNDFGTISYVNRYSDNKKVGEIDSKTIKNLLNKKVGLNTNRTFFTNFYLGVRDDKEHPTATMTYRAVELRSPYKKLCYDFFLVQLKIIKPRMIICLGHEVKNILLEMTTLFNQWAPKSISIGEIYNKSNNNHIVYIEENTELSNQTFILIPHPCYLKNFTDVYMLELNKILESH